MKCSSSQRSLCSLTPCRGPTLLSLPGCLLWSCGSAMKENTCTRGMLAKQYPPSPPARLPQRVHLANCCKSKAKTWGCAREFTWQSSTEIKSEAAACRCWRDFSVKVEFFKSMYGEKNGSVSQSSMATNNPVQGLLNIQRSLMELERCSTFFPILSRIQRYWFPAFLVKSPFLFLLGWAGVPG